MNLQENIDRIKEVMGLNDTIYYHGTGQVTKVIESLKKDTFISHKSGGVENGIFITPNIELAIKYSEQTNGDDRGVVKLKFKNEPQLKKYRDSKELYDDEKSYNEYSIKQSILKHRQELLDNGYDGYIVGNNVILIFKERMGILYPII